MSIDYNQPTRAVEAGILKDALTRLAHGDTVKATFYDKHYRTFEITGVVAAASYDPHLFILAAWFLNTPAAAVKNSGEESSGKGKPSPFLKDLQILETTERTLF